MRVVMFLYVGLLMASAALAQDTTATVRGRVVDGVTGRPVGRARVDVEIAGTRRSVLASPRGEFEFRGLAEGLTALMAEKSGYTRAWYPAMPRSTVRFRYLELRGGRTESVTITMFRKPAISGRVIDEYGDPVESVNVHAWRVSPFGGHVTVRGSVPSNDIGEFRLNNLEPGRYLVAVVPAWFSRRDADREVPSYAPTFYPSVASLSQAQPIDIGPGQSVGNIDVMLVEQQVAQVEGTVVDPEGRGTGGGVTAFAMLPSLKLGRRIAIGGATVTPDGTFSLRLPPGDYEFEAYAGGITSGAGWRYSAVARATVTPGAITTVALTASPQATFSGRVVVDAAGKAPAAPPPVRIIVSSPVDWDDECRTATVIDVKPDGTFSHGPVSGRCVVRVDDRKWALKSILHGDADFADRVMEFRPGRDVSGAQIVLTDRVTEIVPSVTDASGAATDEYVVFAFAQDPARRGGQSRFVRAYTPPPRTRTDVPDARYGTRGLPPGAYCVVALEDLAYDDMLDPAFLEALSRQATAVVLGEAETRRVALRRIVFPPSR